MVSPTRVTSTATATVALLLSATAALAVAGPAGPAAASGSTDAPATGTVFYVAPNGSDTATGTSPGSAWRTLARASRAHYAPGDRLWLQGGATYAEPGGLTITSGGRDATSRVVVESYGGGLANIADAAGSCVTLLADWVTVRDVVVKNCAFAGVAVTAANDRVTRVHAGRSEAGVHVAASASYTRVKDSWIRGNTRMKPNTPGRDDDSGAWGILVNGRHTEITGNQIDGHDAPSADYGRDGAAVEIFGAVDTVVRDTSASGNQTFVEVGGVPGRAEVEGLDLERNVVRSTAAGDYFLVVHAGDGFGRAQDVVADGNDAVLTGTGSVGVVCGPRCSSDVLVMRDNTISAGAHPIQVQGG